ncbi:GNAT family N-acetyltransferase [Colwellia sp. M166]|uniref:bifunctional GNAT family N-acetyltransferase/hotdog fold thioesterase n=1 Tax=Colwellia sp. M166 TaxID=2583805 RepID=UPI00211DAD82|nr:bifunctional GNAT family N-acetyltransferase/hotdog fold thioesterase [Colwellia sp. M166]UUO23302.1 GNAT family N-acetyltransferase [Colwellia sp. M166]|tara:strand:+ start:12366 stop:13271 length:906 start_codon:yes stop_codon:yes gene_type:complete
MYRCRAPKNQAELDAYYQLRWQVLRSPWQQPKGSEQDELESQSYHRVILDDMDNVIGVGRLHKSEQHKAQVRYMAIAETAKGQGLGKLLLTELESIARQVGVDSIELNARESAIGFYLQLGYQDQGFSHLLYEKIAHTKMSKHLGYSSEHLIEKSQVLQTLWHQTIPLSQAMNINICYFDQQKLVTNCEPAFNKNLHHTMFAGSIYTLATLTGWAWVYFALQTYQQQADIVLAEGSIRYLAPLAGVAHAQTCQALVTGNGDALSLGKNARFTIEVQVCCGDKTVALFTGAYVAVLKRQTLT